MTQDAVFITCNGCGTNNRIPKTRLKEHPKCGKCGGTIEPETTIIPCAGCGTKNRISLRCHEYPDDHLFQGRKRGQ